MAETGDSVRTGTDRRAPPPWWVDTLKWILTGFVFPSAVCAFLLWQAATVGKEQVAMLREISGVLEEVKLVLKRIEK